ncbi:porin family protein [Mucilaginibacter gotjawali]|uniref:Uncharacterized protein n=2 Tax=Mucilaginibacter gotjawali TaxID=1550579 RepID=A0A0X8X3Q6_9SPHI|nr:porin family protein [Mucilaginibacter gotjawali]MBB3056361.1 hypothetical protein [Mucilaginibacter gotjawali]BAU55066.1 hypothetical protein MgSA37_03247 [Mucilaginibacter gotjawali]
MKKAIVCLVFTFTFFSLYTVDAQTFTLGLRGGISIPNLTAGSNNRNPLNTGYSSRLGPDFGLFGEFRLSKLFSIQPMLEYSSQGGKKNGLQAITTPDELAQMFQPGPAPAYLYANYKSEAKLNYLLIPVLAKFGWNFNKSPVRFYADAGPFAGFLLSAHQVTSGQSEFYTDPAGTQPLPGGPQSFNANTDVKSSLHTFNVGLEANIGFNYQLGQSSIFIEGGGNFGFMNIQKYAKDGKNNTGAAVATIGYSYRFGK